MRNLRVLSLLLGLLLIIGGCGGGGGDAPASNTATGNTALDITNYMPHTAGNQWSYVNNKSATMTQTMESSVTLSNGLVVIPWTSVDSSQSGQTVAYTTIDENGWRKHQDYASSVYVSGYGNTSSTIVFSPPLSVMPANVTVGSTYTSNVTCINSITNVTTVDLNCKSSVLVVGFETISNNANTESWSALKVVLSMTVSGTINGQFTSQSSATTVWVVDGLGTVQMYRPNNVSMEMETWKLTSTNVTVASNTSPIANAGSDQTVSTGTTVTLNGSNSSDPDGDTLTYLWDITIKPTGSIASVADATSANASFLPDVDGTYTVQLLVNDGTVDSPADTLVVTATTANIAPLADAGMTQTVYKGAAVNLDGSGSSDGDGDSLTYSWTMISKPAGSSTLLANTTTVSPSFVSDVDGVYDIELVVNDGTQNSLADTVIVTAVNVGTVTSAGLVWMDRNLGASRVAISSTDSAAYGDLYQWGRGADGHQLRTSPTTPTLSSADEPGHGDFITAGVSPYDWRGSQNDSLWQGGAGVNNPCPAGFRLPTEPELQAEISSWLSNDAAGAFGSPLKLVREGYRGHNYGTLYSAGTRGYFWSSTVDGIYARFLTFGSSSVIIGSYDRAYGFSVRCIQD